MLIVDRFGYRICSYVFFKYPCFLIYSRCPGISVSLFHGGSKKERERNVLRVQRRGHVLLTSYGMVLNSFENLSEYEGRQFIWVNIHNVFLKCFPFHYCIKKN